MQKYIGRTIPATCVLLMIASSSYAQQQQQQPRTELQTRVYDVSDLVRPLPDYPAPREPAHPETIGRSAPDASDHCNYGGGRLFGEAADEEANRAERASEFCSLVTETVVPDSWRDAGQGGRGTIRVFDDQLVVTQTRDMHERIVELLGQLRQHSQMLVSVRAVWIVLKPEQLASLTEEPARQPSDVTRVLSPKALEATMKQTEHVTAQMTCFNRRRVHVTSNRSQSMLWELTPVVADSAVGWDVSPDVVQSGIELEVSPMLLPDRQRLVLDIQSTLTNARQPVERLGLSVPPVVTTQPVAGIHNYPVTLERVDAYVQRFATTVRVPIGKPVLISGVTPQPHQLTKDAPNLYFVIQADVMPSAGELAN